MSEFEAYCERLRYLHGAAFKTDSLSQKFISYFRGPRIKVRFPSGTEKWGTVSGTTGWRPSLMLLLQRNSTGSSWLLDDRCEIVAIREERS